MQYLDCKRPADCKVLAGGYIAELAVSMVRKLGYHIGILVEVGKALVDSLCSLVVILKPGLCVPVHPLRTLAVVLRSYRAPE